MVFVNMFERDEGSGAMERVAEGDMIIFDSDHLRENQKETKMKTDRHACLWVPLLCLCIAGVINTSCARSRFMVMEQSAFKKSWAKDSVEVEITRGPEIHLKKMKHKYYEFDLRDVPDAMVKNMSYHGTEKGYHLFRIYQKVIVDSTLEYYIAIKESDCEVENPRPIPEEFNKYHSSYRHPEKKENRCTMLD